MILFENERFLAVEKPSGLSMATRPGDASAAARILAALGLPGGEDLRLVHRLDVGTSGIVLVARGPAAHRAATALFSARSVRKVYRAVVWGHPVPARGVVDLPLAVDRADRRKMRTAPGGKRAVTRWTTLGRLPSVAHLELFPETGRTHQIRVHLAGLGHPIVGDDLYGGDVTGSEALAGRHALHASRLAWPGDDEVPAFTVDSPLPAELAALLA